MRRRRRGARWSYSVGARRGSEGRGLMVRVSEREPGGVLYLSVFDRAARGGRGGYRVTTLGHRDQAAAVQAAETEWARRKGGAPEEKRLLLGVLVDRYLEREGPRMRPGTLRWLRPSLEVWRGHFGEGFPVANLGYKEWTEYGQLRQSGAMDAAGAMVPDLARRRKLCAGTVNLGFEALTMAINWALAWREEGEPLLDRSPVRGLKWLDDPNRRRAVWTQARFEKVMEAAEAMTMQVEWSGKRERVRCFLADVLLLAEETGRRIGAVRQLRPCDLRLEADASAPFGRIVWPPETDKKGKEWTTPITREARERLLSVLRARPVTGDRALFPAPRNADIAVDRETLASWLRRAEVEAKVPRLGHDSFHGLRRKFVTERKNLPDKDVAELGGWRSVNVMRRAYQHADEFGMLEALLNPRRLREKA